jgi:hypothetical protein
MTWLLYKRLCSESNQISPNGMRREHYVPEVDPRRSQAVARELSPKAVEKAKQPAPRSAFDRHLAPGQRRGLVVSAGNAGGR